MKAFFQMKIVGLCTVLIVFLASLVGGANAQSDKGFEFIEPVKITIYIPLEDSDAFLNYPDFSSLLNRSPALQNQIQLLNKHNPIGRLGQYDSVFELNIGFEGFTPNEFANPTLGTADKAEITPSIQMIVYSEPSVEDEKINAYLSEVVNTHPWEHPVVEVSKNGQNFLWTPRE